MSVLNGYGKAKSKMDSTVRFAELLARLEARCAFCRYTNLIDLLDLSKAGMSNEDIAFLFDMNLLSFYYDVNRGFTCIHKKVPSYISYNSEGIYNYLRTGNFCVTLNWERNFNSSNLHPSTRKKLLEKFMGTLVEINEDVLSEFGYKIKDPIVVLNRKKK